MEEAHFLTKYGSKVYIIHRRDELRASKIMQVCGAGRGGAGAVRRVQQLCQSVCCLCQPPYSVAFGGNAYCRVRPTCVCWTCTLPCLSPCRSCCRCCWPQKRALGNPKIEFLWNSVVDSAYANEKGTLGGVKVKNVKTGEISDVPMAGLFFAIGHEPATNFLDGQVRRRHSRRQLEGCCRCCGLGCQGPAPP